jgi:hypothetical protein
MARRGQITVECDAKDCQAEQHFDADDLADEGLRLAKYAQGWRWWNGHDICPQCEEAREAERAR